ncbi:MAG: PP-loop domain protein [Xanthobacteraceae bacterium]|nr:PP-loop domain protein [Xanthobacteraceae bacterium]
MSTPEARLRSVLASYPELTIAVSGGVDSMTLAHLAHRWNPDRVAMFHAVSPAVPGSATERVRRHAETHGWTLDIGGSGEFEDGRYLINPVDRCYFCKTNLYDRIRSMTEGVIASGANTDDLGDYRPGLIAAAERDIVHPFVEAGISKADVRALARHHGLIDLAELPAQPCLASRIETGIVISADDLAFVHQVETALAPLLPRQAALRCRVTHEGIVIEADADHATSAMLKLQAMVLCAEAGRLFAGVRPYERGSAFIGKPVLHHG